MAAAWAAVLAVAVVLLFSGRQGVQSTSRHGTHWKAGAGVWHPNDEPLPVVEVNEEGKAHSAEHVDVTMLVQPSVLNVGDKIQVSWSSDELQQEGHQPQATFDKPHGDVIAAYCPDTASDDQYIDYRAVPSVGTKLLTVEFGPVVNMRCRYQFRYLHAKADGKYDVYGRSAVVGFRQGTSEPTQGRLAETGRPGEMSVMWVSDLNSPSQVQFWTSGRPIPLQNATGKPHTYNATDLCNTPATDIGALKFRDPGFIHHVVLTGLVPSTVYPYRYGSDGHWSEWNEFKTAPAPGSRESQTDINFFVYGDLGEWRSAAGPPPGDRAYTTLGGINKDLFESFLADNRFDFVLHVGDISYARGLAYQWEQFGNLVEPVATRIPYYVGIGNHEYDHVAGGDKDPSHAAGDGFHPKWGNYGDDSGGECAVPVFNRFSMPNASRLSQAPFWYAHSYGMIHVIWLSTEHDYYPGSRQYDFLIAELEALNRTLTPWVFVNGHRPMYSSRKSPDNYRIQVHQREAYEDVLHKYGVDIFWSGHYHSYERTCAVYQEKCMESPDGRVEATVHLMVGMAGAQRDPPEWDTKSWTKRHYIDYGYNRVYVKNATHLLSEYVENESGEVRDSVWIVSDHRWHAAAERQWA